MINTENDQMDQTHRVECNVRADNNSSIELDSLDRFLSTIQTMTTEYEVIEHATDSIGKLLYPDSFGVMLLDPAGLTLRCHASRRSGCGHVDMLPMQPAKSIVAKVASEGRSMRVANVRLEPYYYPVNPEIRSELCVPLSAGNQIVGVINLESKCFNAFSSDDEQLLMTIATRLAATIQQIRSQANTPAN
jgi:GAF domain-containing protein